MSTTLNQSIEQYNEQVSRPSLFTRFINWCANQQEDRLLWSGVALFGHGCVLTPLTVLLVMVLGNNILLFLLALLTMATVLVVNLAALPTKITIPVFAFSVLVDLVIILAAVLS